jgi:hypothetical protein
MSYIGSSLKNYLNRLKEAKQEAKGGEVSLSYSVKATSPQRQESAAESDLFGSSGAAHPVFQQEQQEPAATEIPSILTEEPTPASPQKRGASIIIREGAKLTIGYDPEAEHGNKPANIPCYTCGSRELWESESGVIICMVCHPPPFPEDVRRLIKL